MNIIRKRILNLLEEIKNNELNQKNDFCVIKLLFDTEEFNSKCSSIGDFMKKLKNGKISYNDNQKLPKKNNREYFKEIIGEGGFYRYKYGIRYVEIDIFFDIKNNLDFDRNSKIIQLRISKIVNPTEIEIGFNNKNLFQKTFRDITIIETGWNVFGYNR
jgi:hypothetical protein